MAGAARKSGGHNELSLEAHQARGTYRRDRHAHLTAAPVVGAVVHRLMAFCYQQRLGDG